jgi:hypothetical protein
MLVGSARSTHEKMKPYDAVSDLIALATIDTTDQKIHRAKHFVIPFPPIITLKSQPNRANNTFLFSTTT